MITMPITEARRLLGSLHRKLSARETISITSRGKQVFALVPWELYETMSETLEIMSDPVMMKALRAGVADIRKGRTKGWEDAKRDLGLDV
jgi:antitoxin YefM